jgi:hypothetical protein
MFDATAEKKTLPEQLVDAQSKLSDALKKLNDAKTALDAATSSPSIDATKTGVNGSINNIKPRVETPELNGLAAKLNDALNAIYPAVIKLVTTADERLQPFKQNIAEPADLLVVFQNKLGDVPSTIQFDSDLKTSWTNLSAQLKNLITDHVTKAASVDKAVNDLHASVTTVVGKLNSQIAILSKGAQEQQQTLLSNMETFKSDPAGHEKEAIQNIQTGKRTAEALEKINRTVDSIGVLAKSLGITEFNEAQTQAAQKDLTTNLNQLRLRATTYQDLLAGDASLWVTEKLRLYYFTDVPRLVQTLNPTAQLTGGDADARRRAKERLERLRAAEDAQSEANGAVLSLKKRVAILKQQIEAAQAQLSVANFLARDTARKDAELNRRTDSSASDERKKRSLEDKNKAEEDRVAAQERFDKLNDERTGLTAQLREAEAQLEIAQATFERAASATIRAAQVESASFAEARDNAPFWFAGAISTSPDPAKRVEITSSTNGENAIFVRGRREDVVKVQDIVAKLDEPAPQARMTLWKIELNSDATESGAEKFNKALAIVVEELAHTRDKIANALSSLLGVVSEEAELAAIQRKNQEDELARANPAYERGHRKDCEERELYSTYKFPLDPQVTDITGRHQRLRRYSLYSPQVRSELGIHFIDELGFDNPKQFGLKDPGTATTLNEALIIMLMTDRIHRAHIMDTFEKTLKDSLQRNSNSDDEKAEVQRRQQLYFKRLRSMLGIEPSLRPDGDKSPRAGADIETSRQQQELMYAIRGPLLRHLVGRIVRLQDRVQAFQKLYPENTTLSQCLQAKLPKIFDSIHDEFPISPVDIMDGNVRLFDSGDGTIGLQGYRDKRPVGLPKVYNLRPSPARVAAADGMLDVYTKAFEDDIDREFVQPMLVNLRKRLKKSGIGFGVIQRTSMLATNRLVARVDPRATAELSVGQETNLIQGLQSLAQLTLASQTGGVLAGLGQLRASSASEKDAAEIYGITSGSAFQVTPIFDPTGQALRFKFDFVDTTLVREPRGTTNPRLPRIERHTVNTEVQLANLEIREISRFESDSKIGLPTTYWGGVPLLKDIPGVRPIPLIGWFVRRKGSNAIAQRSLIFAQTTMSPTIGDILNLFDTSLQRR